MPDSARAQTDQSVESYYEDAVKHFKAGRLKHAHIRLQNALQRDSKHLPTYLLLGELYLYQLQFSEAAAEFERSLESDKNPEVAALYADALTRSGQPDVGTVAVPDDNDAASFVLVDLPSQCFGRLHATGVVNR